MKARAKSALGRASGSRAARPVRARALRGTVNVVYYHYIGPPVPYYDAFYAGTTPERLDADLRLLARDFAFASLDDVLAGGEDPRRKGRPACAVTFDDGFAMGDEVRDVLAAHEVSATTFVVGDCVGNRHLMWRHKLSAVVAERGSEAAVRAYGEVQRRHGREPVDAAAAIWGSSASWPMAEKDALAQEVWEAAEMPHLDGWLDRHRPYETWDGLRSWMAAGHSVGAHTATHPYCARLDPGDVAAEIDAPAALLRRELGLGGVKLSYPFGSRLPADVERAAAERGAFTHAFGIRGLSPRGTPPTRLERASAEKLLPFHVFAQPLLRRPSLLVGR